MKAWLENMLSAAVLLTPDERQRYSELVEAISAEIEKLGVEITPEQIDRIIDEKCAEAIARREYAAFKQQLQAVN